MVSAIRSNAGYTGWKGIILDDNTFMKQLYIAIITSCLVSLTACSSNKKSKESKKPTSDRNKPINVQVFVVQPTTITESIEVPGSVLPFESTELHPEVAGRVTGLYIKEGSYVKKGASLVKLFDGDLQAQLKKLQIQKGIAETTASRYEQLLKIGGISQQEYDLSKLEISNINADMEVIRTNIARTSIIAPFSGRIGLRSVSLGAYVTPASILATLQQTNQLKLEFTIPEKYTDKMAVGRPVSFTIEGNEKKYAARVMATESFITADNRSLRIRAVVNGSNPSLVPGAFAKVNIDLGDDKNALLVPSQAVIPQARNKQVILYKNGSAQFATVTTNVRDSAMVQITSGIEAGDTVVITGLMAIKPNAKIQITKTSRP